VTGPQHAKKAKHSKSAAAKLKHSPGVLLRELRSGSPGDLERLAAGLLGRLLRVRVSVAKAGFQYGGDAGTAGRAGRHMRLECKRYADTNPLSDRELQGEIDDAMERTPALEAWILVATRAVTETTEETLNQKGLRVGLPIVIIDWAPSASDLPDLAALCAWAPDLVEIHYGTVAANAARKLSPAAPRIVERIRRELEPWKIGLKELRRSASQRIRRIWHSAEDSRAALAQNAAGGLASHLVPRHAVIDALGSWWRSTDSPLAVVHGTEGVGKTWATLRWIVKELRRLPITLVIPASAFAGLKAPSESGLLEFLAQAVTEVTRAQDTSFWRQRLTRMLSAESKEPMLLLLIDGANQEPSLPWPRVVQVLRGGVFRSQVRIILTTQSNYLEQRLHDIHRIPGITRVGVEPYDASPGGELDQLLAHHGRTLASLNAELLPLARIPRLFPLVMKLSANAQLEGDVTLPRLLWAYGRDELGLRTGRAFSEADWMAWLLQLAQTLMQNIRTGGPSRDFSLTELDGMVARSSLEAAANYRRLDEIIDGTWMERVPNTPNSYRPKTSTVYLALGATLLQLLEDTDATHVESALTGWLDPVAATSAAADILAFAVSIGVAKALPRDSAVVSALVTALLQSQNAQDAHRQQLVALAPAILEPLLDAVERSGSRAFASARQWALQSLRAISSSNTSAWEAVSERLAKWVAHAQCPRPSAAAEPNTSDEHQAKRLKDLIGESQPGVHRVMGVPIRLHEWESDDLAEYIPTLLFGKPLVLARAVFVAAAVATIIHIRASAWDGLKWLVSLNPTDPEQIVEELRRLSEMALAVPREVWVSAGYPARVASLLLSLTGVEDMEREAAAIRVSGQGTLSYATDYLAKPARSLFRLERRHLDLLWKDDGVGFVQRVLRAKEFLPDPSATADPKFIETLRVTAEGVDATLLDTSYGVTSQDHAFQDLMPGLARLVPEALADVIDRWFASLATRTDARRHWASLRSSRYLLLADATAAAAAATARRNRPEPPHKDEPIIATQLLGVELLHAPIDQQLDALVLASDAHLLVTLMDLLQAGDADTVWRFLERWGTSNARAVEVGLTYIAHHVVTIDARTFDRLAPLASGSDLELRNLAFMALQRGNEALFGALLERRGWHVEPSQTTFEQEHGSAALLAVHTGTPLVELRHRVAPWSLLTEALRRGGSPQDAKVAAEALNGAMHIRGLQVEHPDVDISIDLTRQFGQISFQPPESTSTNEDPSSLRELFDQDAQQARRERAHSSGQEYLSRARDAGAVLASRIIGMAEARMLVEHCSAEIEVWLDGYEQQSGAFRRRLNLAAGLYRSLCEALLETDPARGVALWHVLDRCLTITFKGAAGVNDLVHMPFRVSPSPHVLRLRDHLYSLARCRTDQGYLDVAIGATSNGELDWLRRKVSDDMESQVGWRRKRAVLVNGFIAQCSEPTWREGEISTSWEQLRQGAQDWINGDLLARYWWRRFLGAQTPASAFGAWRVFLLCADRRAWTWMSAEGAAYDLENDLGRAKIAHTDANRNQIKSVMEDKETKGTNRMDKHLFGWADPTEWFEQEQLASLE
jgi:hypothetical protein